MDVLWVFGMNAYFDIKIMRKCPLVEWYCWCFVRCNIKKIIEAERDSLCEKYWTFCLYSSMLFVVWPFKNKSPTLFRTSWWRQAPIQTTIVHNIGRICVDPDVGIQTALGWNGDTQRRWILLHPIQLCTYTTHLTTTAKSSVV